MSCYKSQNTSSLETTRQIIQHGIWESIEKVIKILNKEKSDIDTFHWAYGFIMAIINRNKKYGKFTRERTAMKEFKTRYMQNIEKSLYNLSKTASNSSSEYIHCDVLVRHV